jgi:integrase
MPILKTTPPSYRLHKGSGQAVVTLSGKDIYLGVHGTEESQAAYRRAIAEWLENKQQPPASSRTGAKPDTEAANINGLFTAYWRFCQAYYVRDGRPTGELINFRHAASLLIGVFGTARIQDFRPTSLKVVRQHMIDARLSRKTINDRVNRIRRMFKWGVENDLVEPSILHALQAVAPLRRGRNGVKEGPGVKPVPEDLIETTLVYMPAMVQAMIRVQLYTGMRPGELVIMRRGDIDTSGKVWVYRPESHKTEHHGHDRVVYLGIKAQDYIKPYLGTELDAYIFNPRRAMKERWAACKLHRNKPASPPRTSRRITDRYTTATYLRAIYHACDKAFPPPEPLCRKVAADGKRETLKAWNERLTKEQHAELKAWQKAHRWHPHQLRHNAATYLRKEFGIEAARVVLGHKSAGVTEIYAELDRMKAAEIMGQVG